MMRMIMRSIHLIYDPSIECIIYKFDLIAMNQEHKIILRIVYCPNDIASDRYSEMITIKCIEQMNRSFCETIH